MKLALMPCPNAEDRAELCQLGEMMDTLSPEQNIRLEQVLSSWGLNKWGLPMSEVRRAIKKVRNNFP